MGRRSSGSHIYDDLKTVSIADLKRFGYLRAGYRAGTLKWTWQGEPTGEIGITVSLSEEERRGFFQLSYIYNREHSFRYSLNMVALPTNLGVGLRWFFICGRTGRRCTKLHLANGYFQHRSGIPGALYESQTRSGLYRRLNRFFRAHDQIFTPYLKSHYRGKWTKRYLRYYHAHMQCTAWSEHLLRMLNK